MAGLLVRLGVEGPRTLLPPNSSNPLGYWESEPIVEFHEHLLRAAGTTWDAWTPVDTSAATPFSSDLTRLVAAEFGSAPTIVVKDPRMCRFVPFWLSTLDACAIEPAAILVVRDPVEVARSLAARDRLAPEFSLLMWLRHMLDAEHATRALPRSVVSYRELLSDWRTVVGRISHDLRIAWPCSPDDAAESVSQFLKPDLCHHVSGSNDLQTASPLDRWAIQVRDALDHLQRADSVQPAEAFAMLDAVRTQLDVAAFAFGRADETVRVATIRQLATVDADRQALSNHASAMEADRSRLRDHAAALEAERDRTRSQAEEVQRRATALEAELARVRQEVASVRADHSNLAARAERLQRTHDELAGELDSSRHHVQALLSSGSWRVTAPLRALLRLARRATGRNDASGADAKRARPSDGSP